MLKIVFDQPQKHQEIPFHQLKVGEFYVISSTFRDFPEKCVDYVSQRTNCVGNHHINAIRVKGAINLSMNQNQLVYRLKGVLHVELA